MREASLKGHTLHDCILVKCSERRSGDGKQTRVGREGAASGVAARRHQFLSGAGEMF